MHERHESGRIVNLANPGVDPWIRIITYYYCYRDLPSSLRSSLFPVQSGSFLAKTRFVIASLLVNRPLTFTNLCVCTDSQHQLNHQQMAIHQLAMLAGRLGERDRRRSSLCLVF